MTEGLLDKMRKFLESLMSYVTCPVSVVLTWLYAASWRTSPCCARAPKRGATAQRPTAAIPRTKKRKRRRTWCSGSVIRTAWRTRWWTWATSPQRFLRAASMMPCLKRTRIGWDAADAFSGSQPGAAFVCLCVSPCMFESSCWMCQRIPDSKPGNEQQVHDVICSFWFCHGLELCCWLLSLSISLTHTHTPWCCLFCQGTWMQDHRSQCLCNVLFGSAL